MPCLNIPISANGPVLDVSIGVSRPRAEALQKANEPVPDPIRVRGLIDTGASGTCIDPSIIVALKLPPTGVANISTPSTGQSTHACNQYDASVHLISPDLTFTIHAVPVIESELSDQGIEVLIGRDILSQCLLVYNGHTRIFTLAF